MERAPTFNVTLSATLLFSAAVFYLFSYNSGYGYDALEYLVMGRSLAEGTPLYTYFPSKSPGIYYLVAALYRLGVDFDHASLAAVITGIYLLTVIATYLIANSWFSKVSALVITGLTAAAAFFMELNFLQPTALFYICGLLAFDALLRFERTRNDWTLFLAGVALGVGIAIKSSTAFYGLAAGHYLIFLCMRERRTWTWFLQTGCVLGAGVLLVVGAMLIYYWTLGAAHAFIDWTFVFPFSHYPSHTTYLSKAYTKLLWVNAFILGCAPLLLNPRIRDIAFRHRPAVLALLFGGCSYLALLKTQSSHYFFPGAPFLFMFAVVVYGIKMREVTISKRFIAGAVSLALVLVATVGASIALYRPDAMRRLTTIKNFAIDEEPLRKFIQSRVPEDRYVLISGGSLITTWVYWISHRYPPPPFINADVKTIWMLRNQPDEVFRVLDHPLLTLVQFDPGQLTAPIMEDVFGEHAQDRDIMRLYLDRVRTRFQPADEYSLATFWRRGDLSAANTTSASIGTDVNAFDSASNTNLPATFSSHD